MTDQEQEITIEPAICQLLIYEHLIHNCYSETAQTFGRESQIDLTNLKVQSDSLKTIQQRKHIFNFIINGRIKEALDCIQATFPYALLFTVNYFYYYLIYLKRHQFKIRKTSRRTFNLSAIDCTIRGTTK